MRTFGWLLVGWSVSCALACGDFARAQEEASSTPAGHSAHGEIFNEGPRQQAYLMPGTGAVHIDITTENADAQRFFDQGLGQLHGFWYFESERSFRHAAMLDPDCAMAYWGMAMSNFSNDKRGSGFIAEAVKRRDGCSLREQLHIDALNTYFTTKGNEKTKRQKYILKLEDIIHQVPDDIEAKAFLALIQYTSNSHGLPIVSRQSVDALMDQVLEVQPMHPCHHYRIHLWDTNKPERALVSASLCGQSAPGIAHMWHMPGHIYSRLKRYDDAVYQQEASARVDHAHMMRDRVLPCQIHNYAHNNEWCCRNMNFIGRARDAVSLAKNMIEEPRHPKLNDPGKRGSAANYGRTRLLETLVLYEMWEELIELCDTVYLEPSDNESDEVKRLAALGRAHYALSQTELGDKQLAELESRLEAINERTEKAVEKAEQEARDKKKSDKDIKKAADDARRGTQSLTKSIQTALDTVLGYQHLAAGRNEDAVQVLAKVSGLEKSHLAQAYAAAGNLEKAIELAQQAAQSGTGQVYPLATYAELLNRAGRDPACEQQMKRLRELSAHIDLDLRVFQRLAPAANALGWEEDWRIKYQQPEDVGNRPDLASLGPFRWQPTKAPEWSLPDSAGKTVSLRQFEGRPVLLIFYLGQSCVHCVEQLQKFAPATKDFQAAGISLVAVSTENREQVADSLTTFEGDFPIPLLADPTLAAFKSYRAFDDFEEIPLHGTFLIDENGLVRWQDISYEPFMENEFLLKEAKRLLAQPVGAE